MWISFYNTFWYATGEKIIPYAIVCDKENIGYAKSIQNNGGVLENEVIVDGVVEQRYWININ